MLAALLPLLSSGQRYGACQHSATATVRKMNTLKHSQQLKLFCVPQTPQSNNAAVIPHLLIYIVTTSLVLPPEPPVPGAAG